jgi:hypothetical protein
MCSPAAEYQIKHPGASVQYRPLESILCKQHHLHPYLFICLPIYFLLSFVALCSAVMLVGFLKCCWEINHEAQLCTGALSKELPHARKMPSQVFIDSPHPAPAPSQLHRVANGCLKVSRPQMLSELQQGPLGQQKWLRNGHTHGVCGCSPSILVQAAAFPFCRVPGRAARVTCLGWPVCWLASLRQGYSAGQRLNCKQSFDRWQDFLELSQKGNSGTETSRGEILTARSQQNWAWKWQEGTDVCSEDMCRGLSLWQLGIVHGRNLFNNLTALTGVSNRPNSAAHSLRNWFQGPAVLLFLLQLLLFSV